MLYCLQCLNVIFGTVTFVFFMLWSCRVLRETGDDYVGDYTKKSPATLQKSEAGAPQLAGIGEPFTS